MPHGGARPGAGRKSNAEIQQIRKLIDQQLTSQIWLHLIRSMIEQAARGNVRAFQLLLQYRFGDPYASQPDEASQLILQILSEARQELEKRGQTTAPTEPDELDQLAEKYLPLNN